MMKMSGFWDVAKFDCQTVNGPGEICTPDAQGSDMSETHALKPSCFTGKSHMCHIVSSVHFTHKYCFHWKLTL